MQPEEKQMHGQRQIDSDGFTYPTGKYKAGRKGKSSASIKQQKRQDKRAVKAAISRRVQKDILDCK